MLNGYVEKCKRFDFFYQELGQLISQIGLEVGFKVRLQNLLSMFVTKAIAMERSILTGKDLSEDAQLVMWKNFIVKVVDFIRKYHKTRDLIGMLSSGEDDEGLEEIDMGKLLAILDVNSLTEDAVSVNVLRKNNDCYGVGCMKRWGRLIPALSAVIDSIIDVVGGDHRCCWR
ncbi:hypothetical protein Lalb_Chr05g0220281 [Lupinus albus]|uniref:Uncharacterized protein n=1 Tax=Lupinus albus TaxID=3870 RepID=A0A6A4QHS5_LUPAL|nr:hypothetical protein Lalb_Chr05g0220281 [Lupinus albus]